MTYNLPDEYVDANWCPDCGLPRGVCDCEEREQWLKDLKGAVIDVLSGKSIPETREYRQARINRTQATLAEIGKSGGLLNIHISKARRKRLTKRK